MTKSDLKSLRDELLAVLASPALGVPEYAADPLIGRRVGRMLADAQIRRRASTKQGEAIPPLDPAHFKVI